MPPLSVYVIGILNILGHDIGQVTGYAHSTFEIWVTLWASAAEMVSHTKKPIWDGHTIGPDSNRWKA